MRIISFGYNTKHPLLAGTKTVTRRAWKKCSLKKGELVQAWDRSPRFKGKRIAIIRIKSVKKEQLGYAATYGPKELKREGGLWKDWLEFFDLFARSGVHPGDEVFRIEFELVKKKGEWIMREVPFEADVILFGTPDFSGAVISKESAEAAIKATKLPIPVTIGFDRTRPAGMLEGLRLTDTGVVAEGVLSHHAILEPRYGGFSIGMGGMGNSQGGFANFSDAAVLPPTSGPYPKLGANGRLKEIQKREGAIYVASSWRNIYQPQVVEILRGAGHSVYDFRTAGKDHSGFHCSEVDADWKSWTPERYKASLDHPIACEGFGMDMEALKKATETLLVLPCGRSAHLELGYAVGAGQKTAVFLPPGEMIEPELMYKMVGKILTSWAELTEWAKA